MFAWDANPTVDGFLYRQSNNRADEIVAEGRGAFIVLTDGRRAVQLLATKEERLEKSIGRNNLVPFGRVYNRLMKPPNLDYEIPHAGDSGPMKRHGLRTATIAIADEFFGGATLKKVIVGRTRKVSARKIDFTKALTNPLRHNWPFRNVSSSLDSTLIAQLP